MSDHQRPPFFRGNELAKVVGLGFVALATSGSGPERRRSGGRPAGAAEPHQRPASPVVADRDPAFETVSDKTVLGFRDTAAYEILLNRAHRSSPETLASKARRDVHLAQLYDHPAHFRGVPIHILGTALRMLLRTSEKLGRTGWLYEAWVTTFDDVTKESQLYPYVCVFEELPPGFPTGATVSERVTFNGYFLKLMAYRAGDAPRAAPLLVGRLGVDSLLGRASRVAPSAVFLARGGRRRADGHLGLPMDQRAQAVVNPRKPVDPSRPRPNEEIAPEALAEWVDRVSYPAGTGRFWSRRCPRSRQSKAERPAGLIGAAALPFKASFGLDL